jgi:hypothetical protein
MDITCMDLLDGSLIDWRRRAHEQQHSQRSEAHD